MIKIDLYKDIRRGVIIVEVLSATFLIALLAALGVGAYFSIVEASKYDF